MATPNKAVADYRTVLAEAVAGTDGASDKAVAAYRAADTGDKARFRTALDAEIKARVLASDLDGAKVLLAIQEAQAVKITVPTEIDWNGRSAERVVTLRFAADLIESGVVTPSSVPDDTELDLDLIRFYVESAFTNGHEESLAPAVKLAEAPIGGSRAAGGDVAAHVIEVLSRTENGGPLTVADLMKETSAAYPDGPVSSGAISSRIKAGTIDGAVMVPADKENPLRVRLVPTDDNTAGDTE